MSFQWGGLADTTAALETQRPPARAAVHRSRVDVTRFDRHDISTHEDGTALVSTVLTERFTGGIDGRGYADHVRIMRPDGSGIFAGIERIEGTVDGRTGSFILTVHGRNLGPSDVAGTWTVQPGSGTGQLVGLRGRGAFTATADAEGRWHADDEFSCWYESTTGDEPDRPADL